MPGGRQAATMCGLICGSLAFPHRCRSIAEARRRAARPIIVGKAQGKHIVVTANKICIARRLQRHGVDGLLRPPSRFTVAKTTPMPTNTPNRRASNAC
jgi:hypothetical protein